jgi:hypothetical protein
MTGILPKRPRLRLEPNSYKELCQRIMERDSWRCQAVALAKTCRSITNNCEVSRARMRILI